MTRTAHLARRFVTSLDPRPVAAADEEWAVEHLLPAEATLWRRLSRADRRHAVLVARATTTTLGPRATRPVIAAALLHDVGKIESGLGTFGRVVATIAGASTIRGRMRSEGRLGSYLRHDEIGAVLLSTAGSDSLTIAWAREHHQPDASWTVAKEIGSALKRADND